jgi:2-polyprenyl-3-methyl-5-hydroxy-6-metoxy-1,4-benzoquinol methylase
MKDNVFFSLLDVGYRENQRVFLSLLDNNPKAVILDIGCNDGEFTVKIANRIGANNVYGIEIDRAKVDLSSKKEIKVAICDLNGKLPFDNDSFDIITANQVIEHLYSPSNAFKEVYRLLKKGGYAVFSTLNLCSWHNIFFMIFGMQPLGMHLCEIQIGNIFYGGETHGHIRLFSLKALKDMAWYYGFRVKQTMGSGYYPFPLPISRVLSHLDRTHPVYITIKMYK